MKLFLNILFGFLFYNSCPSQTDYMGNKQDVLWTYTTDASKKVVYSIMSNHLKDNPPYLMLFIDKSDIWDTTLTEGVLTTNVGSFESKKDSFITEISYQKEGTTIKKDLDRDQSISLKWKSGFTLPYVKLFTNVMPTLSFLGYFGTGVSSANPPKAVALTTKNDQETNELSASDEATSLSEQKKQSTGGDGEKAVKEVVKQKYDELQEETLKTAIAETWGERALDFFEKARELSNNGIKVLKDVYNGEVKESTEFLMSNDKTIREIQQNNVTEITSINEKVIATLEKTFQSEEDFDSNFNNNLSENKELEEFSYKSPYREYQKKAATIFVGGLLIIVGAPAWPIIGLAALSQW